MPTTNEYKLMLQKAQKDLDVALGEKEELDMRIASLRQAIAGLTSLAGVPVEVHPAMLKDVVNGMAGITHQIKRALGRSSTPLSPPQIRDSIVKEGFDISKYASPLTVIYNTLKRLERQQEVAQTDNKWALKSKK